ncbi:Uncharacterised protein [Vibrio cholerae]|nr:Uncharacterised protein [Vibrio cholerae]
MRTASLNEICRAPMLRGCSTTGINLARSEGVTIIMAIAANNPRLIERTQNFSIVSPTQY